MLRVFLRICLISAFVWMLGTAAREGRTADEPTAKPKAAQAKAVTDEKTAVQKTAGGTTTAEKKGEEKPKPAATKPAAEKPAAEKTKPAETKKPAAEKPKTAEKAKPAAKKPDTKPATAKPAVAKPAAVTPLAKPKFATEKFLPSTTVGFLSVTNVPRLQELWKQTQLGQLMGDPVMKPFSEDLRNQIANRVATLYDRLGIRLEDLEDVPSGELVLALVQLSETEATRVCVMDTTGRTDKAKGLLDRAKANLTKRGAKLTNGTAGNCKLFIYDVPKPENQVDAEAWQTIYFYCEKDGLLGVTDNLGVAKSIAGRAAGEKGESLADQKPFIEAMARCHKDAGAVFPIIRWYLQPLGYAESAYAITPKDRHRRGKPIHKILKNQGFEGLQGVGGFVDLRAADNFEILHRTAVYAPPPYQKSMKMLVFPNATEFAPPKWITREVATYATVYNDILNSFDNFGYLYDELMGSDEEGLWQEVLESLEKDPTGPKLKLRPELVEHLGKRIFILTDYKLPITTTSERLLVAVEAKDEKAVTSAITKWFRADKDVKRHEWQGIVIWESVEPEGPKETPTIEIDMPGETKRATSRIRASEDEEKLLPHMAITVKNGYLLVGSHLDFLQKVLTPVKDRETLVRDVDYNIVNKGIDGLGLSKNCARAFSRTDEEYRATYELVRQGKMPESETMLARLMNGLLGSGKKGETRKQRIDGSKLPEFEVVRRYLGPAGLAAESEQAGWFIKGFLLKKQSH